MKKMEYTTKKISMLSDEMFDKLMDYHYRYTIWENGVFMNEEDFGPDGLIIPYAPVKRVRFFRGTRASGSYNHVAQLAKFKDNYYFAWQNCKTHEYEPGMRLLVARSPDAWSWSDPDVIVGREEGRVFECVGMRATQDELYVIADNQEITYNPDSPGGRYSVDWDTKCLQVYSTRNGTDWQLAHTYSSDIRKLYEGPRETRDGGMLCVCAMKDNTVAVLRWNDTNLLQEPDVIPIAIPDGAKFGNGEGTWYQTKDGRIITFWREDGQTCRVWVSYSDDNGATFSEMTRTDIPNSEARIYAGVLADGRYYLVINAFPTITNRRHLMLLLSDDGLTFNRCYVIVNDITVHRYMGAMKNNGYQYPCCVAEEDRLIVGYSVNKEDMECAIIDVNQIPHGAWEDKSYKRMYAHKLED